MAAFENFNTETTGLQKGNKRKTSSKKNPIKYFPGLKFKSYFKTSFVSQNFFYWLRS